MINGAMSDPNHPRLSVGILLKQAIGRGYDILIDLKGSGFDVAAYGTAKLTATILPSFPASTCCRMPES